jgi:fimbrial isopeptide formation D2 family protein
MIVKFDKNGTALWSKTYGARTFNDCTDVIADKEGGVYITGVLSLETGELLTFLKHLAADGREIWSKTYSDFIWSYHISRTADGGFRMVSGNFGGQRLREWLQTDSLGNTLVRKKIYSFNPTDELALVVPAADNGLVLLGGRTVNNNRDFHLLKLDSLGVFTANTLSGKVFIDQNQNCRFDASETPLSDWLVKAESGSKLLWGFTDSLGYYQIGVDSSNYQVSLVKPNRYWLPCRDSVFVGLNSNYPRETIDFAVKPSTNCPLLEVDIATPLLRRCFENTYYVRYCNRGTATSRGGSVRIVLDKFLTYNSASTPLSIRRGDTLFFNIPNLETNQCGEFTFRVTPRCDSTFIGQTHCVEAHIFPDSICVPTAGWSGASIEVTGSCLRDSVSFLVKNVGTGTTAQPIKEVVIIDDIIFFNSAVPILPPGASSTVKYPATGQTYRLIAEQEPNHPSADRFVTAAVEGCRVNNLTPLSIGFVTHFNEDDGDPFVSIDCHQNNGAYDPNDKQAQPQGIGNQHYIDEGTEIDYTIRFQNTGTDTAFTVVVRDTLSAFLDPTTVHLGARSHAYDFDIVEGRILKFTFKNIQLVDSFRNAARSQGFLKFNIKLKKDVPFNAKIENSAAIYFDFNAPVLTNKTFHTLRKPEKYNSRSVPLCDNQPFNGRIYTTDARVYDTLRLTKYDSIVINALRILPTFKKSVDTTLRRGQLLNGIGYQRDTTITIKYAAKNGCDSTVTYKLKIMTATHDLTDTDIKIYPNPFTNETTFEIPPQYIGSFELKIYDATAQLLETKTVSDNKFTFNKGLLKQGVYFFSISNNKLIFTVGKLFITE